MTFNQDTLNAAIETARRKVASNAAWSRSVEKAASALLSGQLIVTVLKNGGIVSSERGTYRITNGFCSCPAAMNGCAHCYHVSALRITERADDLKAAPVAAPVRADIIADIKAAWSRRFPGESLADELLRRFRVNTLDFLAEDMLRGVLAACA
jgi:predicted nucleic acid-binding Zn finger protein